MLVRRMYLFSGNRHTFGKVAVLLLYPGCNKEYDSCLHLAFLRRKWQITQRNIAQCK
jgi:hypothetical protein